MTGETVGEYLKKERELRQISLQEVAEETKISVSRLKALEANQFDQLPAPIYIRGFVRIYAEYIGLDPADVMMRFEDELFFEEQEQQKATTGFKTLEEERALARRRMVAVAASIIGAIVLIALGLYFYFDQQSQQNRAMEGLTLPESSLTTGLPGMPSGSGAEEGAGIMPPPEQGLAGMEQGGAAQGLAEESSRPASRGQEGQTPAASQH